ncbi:hypothetical protein KKH43_04205 [Patescibacteria group bacterium]|nr:hypothetical protein [Patescibacteria group bacterium]
MVREAPGPEIEGYNKEIQKGTKEQIVLIEGPEYKYWEIPEEIERTGEIAVSQDGSQLMLGKLKEGGEAVFVNFRKGSVFERVKDLQWAQDSSDFVYIGKRYHIDEEVPSGGEIAEEGDLDDLEVLICNGEEVFQSKSLSFPAINPNGETFSCVKNQKGDKGDWSLWGGALIINGKRRTSPERSVTLMHRGIQYSLDGKKIAVDYSSRLDREDERTRENMTAILDEENQYHIIPARDTRNSQFSPDSNDFYCTGIDFRTEIPTIYKNEEGIFEGDPDEQGYYSNLKVAPDSTHCAYTHVIARENAAESSRFQCMINGERRGEPVNDMGAFVWSRDSSKVAIETKSWKGDTKDSKNIRESIREYSVKSNDEHRGKEYDSVSLPTYSSDGKHLAYFASNDSTGFMLVFNDEEYPLYDNETMSTKTDQVGNRPLDLRFEEETVQGTAVSLEATFKIDGRIAVRTFMFSEAVDPVKREQLELEDGLFSLDSD